MDDFELQLKNALSRREPPPWLEAKVLAAASREPAPLPPGWWARLLSGMRLRWVSAVVAACLVITGVAWQQERAAQERAAGASAKAKLELALHVTSVKLRQIKQLVEAVNQDN